MDGEPLFGGEPGKRVLISEAMAPEVEFGWSRAYAATDGGLKLVLSPKSRVYPQGGTPEDGRAVEFEALNPAHTALRDGLRKIYAQPLPAQGPRPEDEERLRSLGYLGGGSNLPEGEFAVRNDPDDPEKARVIRDTVWLRVQILRGSGDEAALGLPKARALLKKFPSSPALRELVVEGEKRSRIP